MSRVCVVFCVILLTGCTSNFTRINLAGNIRKSKLQFEKKHHANYVIYAEQPQRFSDSVFHGKLAVAIKRCKQILRIDTLKVQFEYVFVNSANAMKKMAFGFDGQGIAFVDSKVVIEQANSHSNGYGAHELFHVILYHQLGSLPKDAFTSEGLAVFSDNRWWGYDLHAMANYITHKKQISIADIISNFRSNELVSYPLSGSFIKFLYEKYGLEAVSHAYKNGMGNIEVMTKKKLWELESEWRYEIKDKDFSAISYSLGE